MGWKFDIGSFYDNIKYIAIFESQNETNEEMQENGICQSQSHNLYFYELIKKNGF